MSYNGSGTYGLPAPPYPAVAGEIIKADDWNTILLDIASALSLVLVRDGQAPMTGNLHMGTKRITNLADGITGTDGVTYGQVLTAAILALKALTPAADQIPYFTSGSAAGLITSTSFGRGLLALANQAALLTAAGAEPADATILKSAAIGVTVQAYDATTLKSAAIGVSVQAYDATLAALAAVTTAADKLIYATGADTFSTTDLTAFARTLLDDADAAAMRTTLGLVIGTNVQAYDAELAAIAGLTSAAGKGIRFTGSGTAETIDISDFAKTFLDDANATAVKATLGISESGGGEWEEVTAAKTTANNSASVVFSGLDGDTYDYRVVVRDAKPGTTGTTLRLETGYGAGPTYRNSDYSVAITASDQGGSAANVSSVDQAIAVISPALATATADRVRADLEFGWDGSDTISGLGKVVYIGPNGGTNPAVKSGAFGMVNYTNGLTALRFTMSSGNIASGVFRLFRRTK